MLKGGHSSEVGDVCFTYKGEEVCSIGDDMVGRVWRDGSSTRRSEDEIGEKGCGWGWAEIVEGSSN